MSSVRLLVAPLLALIVLTACIAAGPTPTPVAADCEEELAAALEELNETKAELANVTQERDDYAQRLQDSTMVPIIVVILLVLTYVLIYINNRRHQIRMQQAQIEQGIDPVTKEKRRRRRRG